MARCAVGSNWPVTTRGARQAYAACTLCAPIIGNRSPNASTIVASTPVRADGTTRCPGTSAREVRSVPLNQWTRKRFAASGSSGPTPASRLITDAGTAPGSASCANVGRAMPADRNRSTARSRRRAIDDVGLETERGHRSLAASSSINRVASSRTCDAGMLGSPATRRFTISRLPSPAARNITSRALFTAGTVSVIRTRPR